MSRNKFVITEGDCDGCYNFFRITKALTDKKDIQFPLRDLRNLPSPLIVLFRKRFYVMLYALTIESAWNRDKVDLISIFKVDHKPRSF
jgi:hypothetical protein